jgi:putative IMPACT (imprinted ancient) family translation regulator
MSAQTLAAPARIELVVKKSRFLAQATPVESPAHALAWLEQVADRDATHNCWAYRIGSAYRFSDDGEPGGTAGRPILAAIEGQGIDQAMVAVTRWYGGINLGAGGLVRAYGGVAAECLRTAVRRPLVESVEAELACDFALAGAVHGLLAAVAAEKLAETFDEHGLRLRLRLPAAMYAVLAGRLRDASRGAATLHTIEAPTT